MIKIIIAFCIFSTSIVFAGIGEGGSSLGPLPVELVFFNATETDGNAYLNWQTATELNNFGFEIQRKNNIDTDWIKIGFVEGHGNSNSVKGYSFVDTKLVMGESYFRLKQIDTDGKITFSKAVRIIYDSNETFILKQNYPNPFNPSTIISYNIPSNAHVNISVYDILGKRIAVLVDENKDAGNHNLVFSSEGYTHLSNGIYFYKIEANEFSSVKKMLLLK